METPVLVCDGAANLQPNKYVVSQVWNFKELDELDRLDTEWAYEEGWITLPGDMLTLRSLDSVFRLAGVLDGQVVSMISCINYSDGYAFLTSFMTKKRYRGKGYGGKLLDAALSAAGRRTVGLTCGHDVKKLYARKGFVSAIQIATYVVDHLERFGGFSNRRLVNGLDLPPTDLADFDEKYFPARRQDFLQAWIRLPQSIALAPVHGGKVLGYGVLARRSDGVSGKVGPLFADSFEVACEILRGLLSGGLQYERVFLDVLESNVSAPDLVSEFGAVRTDTSLMMFKNGRPEFGCGGVYCMSSGLVDAPDFGKKVEMAQKVLNRLEPCRRTLLGWIFVHMSHIIDHQDTNKMTLKNVALVLEPTLRIQSNKVLNFLLTFPTEIFHDVKICKLAGPGQVLSSPEPVSVHNQSSSGTTEQALLQLREELVKKEASLNQLHHEIKQGKASKRKEEQLWDIQRQVTQLKRKIRTFEKMTTVTLSSTSACPSDTSRKPSSSSTVSSPPSSTTLDQHLHPKPSRYPVIQVETRPAAMLVPVKSYPEPQSQEAPVVDKDWVDSGDVTARKEDVEQLVLQWSLYEALLGHNRSLRERIRKEEEGLEKVWEELAGMPRSVETGAGEQLIDENVDVDSMRRELVDLVEKYRSYKQMSSELNDAVCSETADWIRIVGELNALKMRAA